MEGEFLIEEIHRLVTERLKQIYEAWAKVLGPRLQEKIEVEMIEQFSSFLDSLEEQARAAATGIKDEIDTDLQLVRIMEKQLKTKIPWSFNEDLALYEVKKDIERVLQSYRAQKKSREAEVVALEAQAKALSRDLEEPMKELEKSNELPTQEELQIYRDLLAEKKRMRDQRLQYIREMQREARVLPHIDSIFHDDHLKPTKHNVCMLESGLEAIRDQLLKLKIEHVRSTLSNLWKHLGMPDQQTQFKGSSDNETLENLLAEQNRCEVLKVARIESKIEQLKLDILAQAEKCLMSQEFIANSVAKTSFEIDEDVLNLHEGELLALKKYYAQNSEVLKLYESREAAKSELTELKEHNKEGRFKNRGGALLKEEKAKKKLAQLDIALAEAVKRYEAQHHEPFKVYGKPVDVDRNAKNRPTNRRANSELVLKPLKDIGNLK